MSILLTKQSRVIVQGITSEFAQSQTASMLRYGTRVVAGVTPGRGGSRVLDIPVFDTVGEALAEHPADVSVIYVGNSGIVDAVREATAGGVKLIFVTADGLPVQDVMAIRSITRRHGVWMLGPNSLGMITPGEALLGAYAPAWAQPGRIGVMSRGGTLLLNTSRILTEAGVGISTAVHVGGEAVLGRNPIEYLQAFEADPGTDAIVMLSEVGGGKDHEAAKYIPQMKKPVVFHIVGRSVPVGKAMGHAGAMVDNPDQTVVAKQALFVAAGAHWAESPEALPAVLKGFM